MTNRFTVKAQNVLNNSLRLAREMGHTYIGSEHLLLALCAEKESVAAKLLEKHGIAPEAIREDLKPQAEIALRCNAAIDLIVEIEGLTAEKEEIAEALALICRQNGMTMEQLKPHYDAELEHAITRSVLTSKVMRLIRDAATVTAE